VTHMSSRGWAGKGAPTAPQPATNVIEPTTRNMVWVPGGTFTMGSADFYPEERPVHRASVDGFWMDEHPVTVGEYRRFVVAAGYVTVAQRRPDPADFPDADPALLVPGSLVFRQPPGPVDMRNVRNWWDYVPGASWQRPSGPGSGVKHRERHPVTHVAYEDAQAYATWAGKELPSETEWEFAARGGLDGAPYVWGDEFAPAGELMANTWQGEFPWQNLGLDGYEGTSPVGAFPANGYGLLDMAGNVWEWTSDYFSPRHPADAGKPCCVPRNPRATSADRSKVAGEPGADMPRKVIKGGSHLCAPSYCLRYRPAARQGQTLDTAASHLGFRCIVRVR
jgi:formylglycine-generating enzyme